MGSLATWIAWIALGFLCGSIPFGWLAARAKGIDIRTVGSGNIGGTNVWRALGWRWGLSVLLADVLKGLAPVGALLLWIPTTAPGHMGQPLALHSTGHAAALAMLTGLAAILGHTFTPWLRFRGGKGVATGLGVVIALYQIWVLVPLAVFGITLGVSRFVSLSSMLAALSAAVLSLVVPQLRPYWPLLLPANALIIYMHKSNIGRIMAGTESRVGAKRQAK
jgi:acyl phosphate:glycerol-3-phosphate acyltransferase